MCILFACQIVAAPSEWDTSVGQVVPVGAYVVGNVWDTAQSSHKMEHYYNLFHFRPEIDHPNVFEVTYPVLYL